MTENLGMRLSTTVYGGIFLFLAVICLVVHFYEPYLHKKKQEKKWRWMKQNLGEEMPLVKKDPSSGYKPLENGRIPSQSDALLSHCIVPVSEKNDVILSDNKSKLEWLDDPAQAKNFWLT
ncbi:uncharacterized protein [Parasteatoda tepidariorum]|uniref:uncharacterized protein n=1 Tax=Parasteatoda tepidariorum TaxID=114398 RepID=UPI001C72943D|nr:uncharacterized protein LOC122273607 [Parasteatoda tepidariorum]